MENYTKLEEVLSYNFKDKELIKEALTHKSYKKPYNNERLEFLGDAVLDLIVGEFLYEKFYDSDEGILSKIRASLVNESGFTLLAKKLNLGEYIYLSVAEENNNNGNINGLLTQLATMQQLQDEELEQNEMDVDNLQQFQEENQREREAFMMLMNTSNNIANSSGGSNNDDDDEDKKKSKSKDKNKDLEI